jgi:hypothetical protein
MIELHIPILLSTFITYHWSFNKSNRTGATCTAGTTYSFGVFFSGVRVIQSLVLFLEYLFICSLLWEAELVET